MFVFLFTRCVRSTLLLVTVAVAGVVWLLGLMQLLGYELDPYSILVPFLIFAIGLSHGAQKMNGILQDVGRGTHKYVAARYTFRRLFMAGLTALLTNIVGFAVLIIIDIPVIRDLAITTSIGVTVLIFTKLVLIPVSLSYIGVSEAAARRALAEDRDTRQGRGLLARLWQSLDRLTERKGAAIAAIASALLVTGVSAVVMRDLRIGDLDPGAPELRADSRYNRDNAYITGHYGLSSDQFVVIMKTDADGCRYYDSLQMMDRLALELRQTTGVQATNSLAETTRFITAGLPKAAASGSRSAATRPSQRSRSAAMVADTGHHEPELLRVAAHRLPQRPQGRHAGARAEGRRILRSRYNTPEGAQRHTLPARGRFGRHRGGDQHRGRAQASSRCTSPSTAPPHCCAC